MLESYFTKPRRRLGLTIAISSAVYAVGISSAIIWSFYGVSKVKPRYVAVAWAATPAPPPPPPAAETPAPPAPVGPPTNPIVRGPRGPQPPIDTTPPTGPTSTAGGGDPDQGTPGGTGVPGGTGPETQEPTPEPPPPPQTVQIQTLNALRIAGDPMVRLPPLVVRALADQGVRRADVKIRLCLSDAGVPTEVSLLRGTGNAAGDDHIRDAIRGWRYRPFQVNGRAVPVCTALILQYHID